MRVARRDPLHPQIPADAYEINFVPGDAEVTFENNQGQDFMFPVAEGITAQRWAEILAEQARQRELERLVRVGARAWAESGVCSGRRGSRAPRVGARGACAWRRRG